MDVLIKLSDLVERIERIPYLSYAIAIEGNTLFITLFTLDEPVRFHILDKASPAKLLEIENTLRQYLLN